MNINEPSGLVNSQLCMCVLFCSKYVFKNSTLLICQESTQKDLWAFIPVFLKNLFKLSPGQAELPLITPAHPTPRKIA